MNSETFGFESKSQLKATRKGIWKGLLLRNGLDLEMYPWWTQEEKDLERILWIKADEDYETRKSKLKTQIDVLSVGDKAIYFKEIGIESQDTNIWLKPSLLKA